MFGYSPLYVCLGVWAVITAVFVVLMIYRSIIGMHEDDQLFLDSTETSMEQEQRLVQKKLARITPYTKGFGFASLGLAVVSAGIWVYQALTAASLMP